MEEDANQASGSTGVDIVVQHDAKVECWAEWAHSYGSSFLVVVGLADSLQNYADDEVEP